MTRAARHKKRMAEIWDGAKRIEHARLARGETPNPNLSGANEQDKPIGDGDYTLTDGSAWFTVGEFSVRLALWQTDTQDKDELRIQVFKAGCEANDPIGTLTIKEGA